MEQVPFFRKMMFLQLETPDSTNTYGMVVDSLGTPLPYANVL